MVDVKSDVADQCTYDIQVGRFVMMFHEKLDIKLIGLVRDNPVLYDFNNGKYMDFNAREVAWQKIGDELQRPAAVCKLRWINIRDVYRRIIRKKMSNPGIRMRTYKYENELIFMRSFYRDVHVVSEEEGDKDEQQWNDDDFDDVDNTSQPDLSDDIPIKMEKKVKTKKRKRKKIFEVDEKPEPITEEAVNDLNPSDPVDAFLISIGATLRTFSPYHLNLAKSKIFAVVQEHDLEQIVQKSNDVKVSVAADSLYIP